MSSDLILAKSIDLAKHELKNARTHQRASDPTGLVAGDKGLIWFNTTDGYTKYWNGTSVVSLGAAPDLSAYYTKTESDSRYLQSIPGSYATDLEVAAVVTAHEAALNPHPQYLTEADLGATDVGGVRYATLVKYGL